MNDDFEKRLQQIAPREIPTAWREQFLTTAQDTAIAEHPSQVHLKALPIQITLILWRELIQPAHRLWAGLATAWVLLLVANSSIAIAPRPAPSAKNSAALELWQRLQEEQKLFTELTDTTVTKVAPSTPPFTPQPRSEQTDRWKAA